MASSIGLRGGLGSLGGGTLGQVLVRVGIDTRQLDAGLAKAKGEAGTAGTTFSKFGQYAAAGFALAGVAAVKFAADAIKSATEHEQVLAQLQIAVGSNTKAFEDQATALQNLTGFQDEEVLAADTVLARFKLTRTEITGLTPLVLDYARATGQDAAGAAGALGKALLGNTRALKTIGISFTATGDKAADLATISKLLEDRVGGASEAFGQTFAGKVEILKAKFDDFKEVIGAAIIPLLSQLIDELESVGAQISGIINLLPGMGSGAEDAAGGVTGLQKASAGLSFVWHALLHPLDTIVNGFEVQIPDGASAAASAVGELTEAQKATAAAAKAASDALKAQRDAMKALLSALPGLIGAVLSLKNAQKELRLAQKDSSVSADELHQKELGVVEAFFAVKSAFGDIIEKYKAGKATVADVIGKFKDQAAAAGLTRGQIQDLLSVVQEYINKLRAVPSVVTTNVVTRFTREGPGSPQQMAAGGIVTRPTFALIGEAGPEAVIPLDRAGRMGGGTTVNIYVDGSVVAERDLKDMVKKAAQLASARNAGRTGF